MDFFKNLGKNPIGNGGGTCKTIEDVKKFIKTDIEAIEIGSITEETRDGNTGNTFHFGGHFTLNSLGLPNPGRKYYEEKLKEMVKLIHDWDKKAIVNVVGFNVEENASLTRLGFDAGADLVVLNLGCPNVWVDNKQKGIISYDLESLEQVVLYVISKNKNEAREGRIGIKLSPILDPSHIVDISSFLNGMINVSAEFSKGFIGFITTQNTVPNCYDEEDSDSFITPGKGLSGMGGKSVLPIALGQVRQFRAALDQKIKIIGVGGVTTGHDVEKMIGAGANFVQIVSAYYKKEDVSIYNFISAEFADINE